MAIAKRVFLFLIVNLIVLLTISFILQILHVQPYLKAYGMNYQQLLIFCFLWGSVGSFISLLLSKQMAIWMMGVKIIDPNTADPKFLRLVEMVKDLSERAGLEHSPAVGIYTSKEANAFATGATKSHSLIAVSSGLLEKMQLNEIQGVLGHEVSHIANGDMVTMTLLQGIVNAFVMFFARILAYAVSGLGKDRDRSSSYFTYRMMTVLFEVVFMILGSIPIAAFSRFREFRADSGSAQIAGRENMIQALKQLRNLQEVRDVKKELPAFHAMKISAPPKKSVLSLFATHPPLEERISRLETFS